MQYPSLLKAKLGREKILKTSMLYSKKISKKVLGFIIGKYI